MSLESNTLLFSFSSLLFSLLNLKSSYVNFSFKSWSSWDEKVFSSRLFSSSSLFNILGTSLLISKSFWLCVCGCSFFLCLLIEKRFIFELANNWIRVVLGIINEVTLSESVAIWLLAFVSGFISLNERKKLNYIIGDSIKL